MQADKPIKNFLSRYSEDVYTNAIKLREMVLNNLPNVTEQLDLPAKMIAYCYGQKYIDMICVIIPSKKEIKLSFYKGIELDDPHKILEGTGKFSRYVKIKSEEQIKSPAIKQLLKNALVAYKARVIK